MSGRAGQKAYEKTLNSTPFWLYVLHDGVCYVLLLLAGSIVTFVFYKKSKACKWIL
ncbi:MAG: hypothetical protein Q4F29_14625 [Lachnospiraceae bacterium]|nr:hypothetical protein [Lachnospiraceae bacterium]